MLLILVPLHTPCPGAKFCMTKASVCGLRDTRQWRGMSFGARVFRYSMGQII